MKISSQVEERHNCLFQQILGQVIQFAMKGRKRRAKQWKHFWSFHVINHYTEYMGEQKHSAAIQEYEGFNLHKMKLYCATTQKCGNFT